MIKANGKFFCPVLSNIGFSYEDQALKSKIRFVMQLSKTPPLCGSTILISFVCTE
jgi:hypothetical protein